MMCLRNISPAGAAAGLLTLAFTISSPQASRGDEGYKVSDKKDGYSAIFPSKPKFTEEANGGKHYMLAFEKAGAVDVAGVYVLQVGRLGPNIDLKDKPSVKHFLGRVKKGLLAGFPGSKLVSAKDDDTGPHPTLALKFELADSGGEYVARIILDNQHLYQVSVVGDKLFVNGDDAVRFLDSFALED